VATQYHCDRCDRQVDTKKELFGVTIDNEYVDNAPRPRELCKFCLRDLQQFLKPLPKSMTEVQHAS
jgi:hypothetical protein